MSDLFGEGRQLRGLYAAPPGTGPAGETCGTCRHVVKCGNPGSKGRWFKCKAIEHRWTGGRATDVLATAPACERWEKRRDA